MLTDVELYSWAKAHEACIISGPVAQAILRVLAERDAAQRIAGVQELVQAWKEKMLLRAAVVRDSAGLPA